ncbi:MAG TPA: shikimate kinase [Dissulfurispiraceae bacterium]|nr:shikimate kinase [Dissulfurispiraceae bacterium]
MRLGGGKNIVLSGFMGTGKTKVGRTVAKLAGMAFIDVDAEIETRSGMSIPDLFTAFGEPEFRRRETETIRDISAHHQVVIATGGGAVINPENVSLLKQNGVIVCLTATIGTILKRVGASGNRPLLKGGNPEQRIRELLTTRQPFYEQADIMVKTDGKSPRTVAVEILERVAAWDALGKG